MEDAIRYFRGEFTKGKATIFIRTLIFIYYLKRLTIPDA